MKLHLCSFKTSKILYLYFRYKHNPTPSQNASTLTHYDEDLMSDELVTVSNWLVSLETPYQAQVQYEYFLSSGEEENYKKRVSGIGSTKEI